MQLQQWYSRSWLLPQNVGKRKAIWKKLGKKKEKEVDQLGQPTSEQSKADRPLSGKEKQKIIIGKKMRQGENWASQKYSDMGILPGPIKEKFARLIGGFISCLLI